MIYGQRRRNSSLRSSDNAAWNDHKSSGKINKKYLRFFEQDLKNTEGERPPPAGRQRKPHMALRACFLPVTENGERLIGSQFPYIMCYNVLCDLGRYNTINVFLRYY